MKSIESELALRRRAIGAAVQRWVAVWPDFVFWRVSLEGIDLSSACQSRGHSLHREAQRGETEKSRQYFHSARLSGVNQLEFVSAADKFWMVQGSSVAKCSNRRAR